MIIDAHSHIGKEKFTDRKEILLEDYCDFCKEVGINAGLVMPVPCHIIMGKIILTWKYENGSFIDLSEVEEINDRKLQNPYKEVNYEYYKSVSKFRDDVKLYFIPMIHPRLDTPKYLEKLILDMNPIALKVHSVGTLSSPKHITKSVIDLLKKYDIPLIVHSDLNNGKFDANIALYEAVKFANPNDWFDFFENNHIKGVLNHGAALSPYVLNKINKSQYVKIAIGPDLFYGKSFGRLGIDKAEYDELGFLGVLKKYVSSDKLVFDVDYDYNRDQEKNLDLDVIKRVKEIWADKSDYDKIFYKNIIAHYPKLTEIYQGDEVVIHE